MKTGFRYLLLAYVCIGFLASCPVRMAAQYVFVNDNNNASGGNTATAYQVTGTTLSLVTGSPFPTLGTGLGTYFAANQVVEISYGGSFKNCLFVSDPDILSSFPGGDVASFVINGNGTLTHVGNFTDPNASGQNKRGVGLAVDRRVGFPYLFASFTDESKIVYFKVDFRTCKLFFVSATPAAGASGGAAEGMMVSKQGPHIVAVAYDDGSIQSFKVSGGLLVATQAAFNSTGFVNQGGHPAGVDITKNGQFAVFGDNQFNTEVEVAAILPSGQLQSPTVDYGGAANASGVNLGPGSNSNNVWISPAVTSGYNYLYISNNYSGQVTTAQLSSTGVVSAITTCVGLFTNPTTLKNPSSFWTFSAGIHTVLPTGTGQKIVVAEYGVPSSVALLKVQAATGCTHEVAASPFADPFSNRGLFSVSVFPSRPF